MTGKYWPIQVSSISTRLSTISYRFQASIRQFPRTGALVRPRHPALAVAAAIVAAYYIRVMVVVAGLERKHPIRHGLLEAFGEGHRELPDSRARLVVALAVGPHLM